MLYEMPLKMQDGWNNKNNINVAINIDIIYNIDKRDLGILMS